MKYIFILLLSGIFSLNCFADKFPNPNILRCKKVLDATTGKLADKYSEQGEKPKFPGGDEALFHQIYELLGFNHGGSDYIDEKTVVKFLITPEGSIQDITIESSSNEEYDKVIIDALALLPSFLPSDIPDTFYYAWINICCPK